MRKKKRENKKYTKACKMKNNIAEQGSLDQEKWLILACTQYKTIENKIEELSRRHL